MQRQLQRLPADNQLLSGAQDGLRCRDGASSSAEGLTVPAQADLADKQLGRLLPHILEATAHAERLHIVQTVSLSCSAWSVVACVGLVSSAPHARSLSGLWPLAKCSWAPTIPTPSPPAAISPMAGRGRAARSGRRPVPRPARRPAAGAGPRPPRHPHLPRQPRLHAGRERAAHPGRRPVPRPAQRPAAGPGPRPPPHPHHPPQPRSLAGRGRAARPGRRPVPRPARRPAAGAGPRPPRHPHLPRQPRRDGWARPGSPSRPPTSSATCSTTGCESWAPTIPTPSPPAATSPHWLGQAGQPVQAADQFRDLLDDQLRVLGPDHPTPSPPAPTSPTWWAKPGSPPKPPTSTATCSTTSYGFWDPTIPTSAPPGTASPTGPGERLTKADLLRHSGSQTSGNAGGEGFGR